MTVPTIHLNGTSKQSLIDGLCDASDALNTAYEALKQTAPNGRDYYTQGPQALAAATDEHLDRLRRLDAIKAEIDALTLAIDRQG
jgi:hypothetical protein